jgi:hypothetical protein
MNALGVFEIALTLQIPATLTPTMAVEAVERTDEAVDALLALKTKLAAHQPKRKPSPAPEATPHERPPEPAS